MSLNWKNVLIASDSSIKRALKVIDNSGLRMALVADVNHHLEGIVTDGDIRRGLLQNVSLESPVADIMNTNPICVDIQTSKDRIVQLMETHGLLSVPVLSEGKIVGLQTLHETLVTKKHDNPVFLMAGGFGKRLRPLTDNCPKPMLKVGDKPILETIIENFIEYGFHQFYISLHYMPEKIVDAIGDGSRWGVEINYVYEDTPLGTGGALGLLPMESIDLPIIMMNGDLLTKVNFEHLLNYHISHEVMATMCVRSYEYQVPYGVVNTDGHLITEVVEKPNYSFFVNAGVYVLDPEVVKKVKKNQNIDMPNLLQTCMGNNGGVASFPIHEYWLDIGRQDDFLQAQEDILNL